MDEDPQLRVKYGALAKLADLHHEAEELTHNPFQRFQTAVLQKPETLTTASSSQGSEDPLLGLLQEVQSAEAHLHALKKVAEPQTRENGDSQIHDENRS